MNGRLPITNATIQSEAFPGWLKAAPYLITWLSNVLLKSTFLTLRNNEIQGGSGGLATLWQGGHT